MKKNRLIKRLQWRFFIQFLVTGLLAISLLAGFLSVQFTTRIVEDFEKRSEMAVEKYQVRLESFISREIQSLVNYYEFFGPESFDVVLGLIDSNPRFIDAYIIDRNGLIVHSIKGSREGEDYSNREMYRLAHEQKRPIFRASTDSEKSQLVVDIVIPIFGQADSMEYITVHRMNTGWLEERLTIEHQGIDEEILVMNAECSVYMQIPRQKQSDSAEEKRILTLLDYQLECGQFADNTEQAKSFLSDTHLITYKKMPDGMGTIINRVSMDAIDQQRYTIMISLAAITLFVTILYAILGMIMAKRSIRPIEDISRQVKETVEGLRSKVDSDSNSELSIIADAFNQAWAHNKKMQQELILTKERAEEEQAKAEKANNAKSEFLATMSHEIRTPMNAIIGMADVLEEFVSTEEGKKYIRVLKKNGDNLLKIINAVLDLAKIEAGHIELHYQKVDVCALIDEVGDTYSVIARQKGLEILVDIDREAMGSCEAYIDEDRVRQILINLIGNGIKFTADGYVKVVVRKIEDTWLRIVVEDSGIGIQADKLKQIFNEYMQIDTSTTRSFGGTGLGLAISRNLLELMNGRIWAESEEGKGTSFYIEIPTGYKQMESYEDTKQDMGQAESIQEEAVEVEIIREEKNAINNQISKKSVLLVDDAPDNVLLIEAYLKKSNYEIGIARNGQEAVDKYHAGHYDLILMDMQMPVMDGFQATRRIRQYEEEQQIERIPIIALTAYALQEDRDQCLNAGCDEHISKPVKKQTLIQAIKRYL